MKREPKQPWRCRVCPWQARGSRVVQVVHPACPRHGDGRGWRVRVWEAAA